MIDKKVWTVAMVKEELPNVRVSLPHNTTTGSVRGRKNQFATVFYTNHGVEQQCEFSWEAIVHSLNYGGALNV